MKHLGDITKINGAEIPVVDVITGGSPCQDLSVAGKRAGLQHSDLGDEETTRSGLFMDQLRIVKEMRESDRRKGRYGVDVRPRYMVWENVPGAFSSNGGKDFQAVLTEIVRVVEPSAPDVPMPEKGWPYAGCLYDELGRWSVAYRVHDAQYWGVPQRRRRIALVADFNGLSAPEILFDPQLRGEAEDSEPHEAVRDSGTVRRPEVQPLGAGLSRDSEPGGEAGEGTAESPAGRSDGTGGDEQRSGERPGWSESGNGWCGDSSGGAISFQERAGCDGGARESSCRMSGHEPCQPSETNPCFSIQGNVIDRDAKMNGGGVLPECSPHAEQRGQARRFVCRGLPERNREPFCKRDSASEGAGDEPQLQQRCEGPGPKFFQNTGVGWWNEGNAAETIRTPGGGDATKANLVLCQPSGGKPIRRPL